MRRPFTETRSLALVAPLASIVIIAALVGSNRLAASKPAPLDVFGPAPTFALTDQLGRPSSADDFRGKIVVSNFIYTSCQDICPLLSARMRALQDRLQEEALLGTHVQLLSFSVDPARDTPAVLQAYADRYQADSSAWRFLTGPEEQVVPLIVGGFHLGVEALPPRASDGDGSNGADGEHRPYEVMHSGRFVLIDRQWQIRVYHDWRDIDVDNAVREIRQLL